MKQTYRCLIVLVYALLNLFIFWHAQFFLRCNGLFCNLIPTFGVWIVFIFMTLTVFRLKPLSIRKTLLRFIFTASIVILFYAAFYNLLEYPVYDRNRWFLDYSLPGILLTIGFALAWFLPNSIRDKVN